MKTTLIGIAGPSGAGKSTFCRKLEQSHRNVGRLKLDDFFCNIEDVDYFKGYQNWDDPKNINWRGLVEAAKILKDGVSATIPHYDRMIDKCIGEKCVLPKEIIIIDGFLTLHHPELRELLDLSFYFDLSEKEQITRRKLRQPWVEDGYLNEVMIPYARLHIFPSAKHATHVVNAKREPEEIYNDILTKITPKFVLNKKNHL
ncbi:MAG: AAA family ATPase [bacterium]|nr:AAA family ATPase [bacterium]